MSLRTRNKRTADFSMSSLTDIIFLLLIFFILTSTLVAPNAIPMLLPNSNSQAQATETVSMSIDENLNYYLNGRVIAVDEIESALDKALIGKEDQGIVLYADKTVPIDYVVQVLNVANKMKIKVVLATVPQKQ